MVGVNISLTGVCEDYLKEGRDVAVDDSRTHAGVLADLGRQVEK